MVHYTVLNSVNYRRFTVNYRPYYCSATLPPNEALPSDWLWHSYFFLLSSRGSFSGAACTLQELSISAGELLLGWQNHVILVDCKSSASSQVNCQMVGRGTLLLWTELIVHPVWQIDIQWTENSLWTTRMFHLVEWFFLRWSMGLYTCGQNKHYLNSCVVVYYLTIKAMLSYNTKFVPVFSAQCRVGSAGPYKKGMAVWIW